MGGYNPTTDAVEFVTVSTTGNSTDTGNLSSARFTGEQLHQGQEHYILVENKHQGHK